MSFINSYKAPVPKESSKIISDQEPYDLQSNIPVPPVLESARVQLVPFIPAIHGETFYAAYKKDEADIVRYLPASWPTFESFLAFLESFARVDPTCALFVIIDKTKKPLVSADARIPGRIAGVIGWAHSDPSNLSLEIAPVIVLPDFQRSFVSANAIGLLLRYFLDLPADGGLGFRRVAWTANPLNEKSIAAAEKMGFRKEGVMRWTWILPIGKEGVPVGEGRGEGHGRDSTILSVCWDDWVSSVKELVTKKMERV